MLRNFPLRAKTWLFWVMSHCIYFGLFFESLITGLVQCRIKSYFVHDFVVCLLIKYSNSGNHGFYEECRGYVRVVIDESLRPHFKEETYDEMMALVSSKGVPGASWFLTTCINGDVSAGVGGGQVAGLIKDIPSCQELIQRTVKETEPVMKRLEEGFR